MISIQYLLIFWMIHLIVFYFLNCEKKNRTRKLNTGISIVFLALDVARYLLDGYHSIQFYDSPVVLITAVLVLIYSLQGFEKLSMWVITLSSLLIASLVSTISAGFLLTIMRIDAQDMTENPILSIIGMISGVLLLNFFYLIMKKLKLQINVHGLAKKDVLVIMLFLVMFGFYMANMYSMINEDTRRLRVLINILSLLVGALPIYGVIYIITQKDYIKYVESREQQQELLFEEERIHYEKMSERNEEIRIFKHDIDEELDYIDELARNGELNEISTHITKMRDVTARIVRPIVQNTGSNAINSSWFNLTTNEKYADIECEWLGKVSNNIVINNRDVVRLFSNLLRNAFEAAFNSNDKKYVKVEIINQKKKLIIMIKNSYSNDIKRATDGTFITTKLVKENHGIGTRIIKDIVAAYDGIIHHVYDGNEFAVKIVFGANVYRVSL